MLPAKETIRPAGKVGPMEFVWLFVSVPIFVALAYFVWMNVYALAGTIRAPGYKLGAWVDIGYWQRDLAERIVPPREPKASA